MTERLVAMIEFDNVADFSGADTSSYGQFDDALARARGDGRRFELYGG